MQLTVPDVLVFLEVLTFLFLLLALYHLVFVLVGLRRIVKRVDTVTQQVEQVVLKPISMADATVDWVTHMLESAHKKTAKPHAKKASKKE